MAVQREYVASMNEPCMILIELGARYSAMYVASVRATCLEYRAGTRAADLS